jgi:2-polyprenyl-3-methyl-5-hydroxy-6-metoxy-1,4-benzoquinol methylase
MTCTLCGATFAPEAHVRWVKDGHEIVRCPSCGLLCRRELPTEEELDAIYGLSYFKGSPEGRGTGYLDYVGDEDLHRQAARRRLELLERTVPRQGRLLDVGAAAGFFVDEARARGWDAGGLDVSEPMVRFGRETLQAPLELGTLASDAAGDGSLDALTMWDYIEHSIDPVGEVRRAQQLLKPGGALAMSTGDAATLVARVSGSRWHLLTPEHHNYFFTAATLSRLLEENGFEIVTFDHRGSRYPVSYLVHKLRTIVDWSPLELITRRLTASRVGSVALPVNLWDIATVVARRAA